MENLIDVSSYFPEVIKHHFKVWYDHNPTYILLEYKTKEGLPLYCLEQWTDYAEMDDSGKKFYQYALDVFGDKYTIEWDTTAWWDGLNDYYHFLTRAESNYGSKWDEEDLDEYELADLKEFKEEYPGFTDAESITDYCYNNTDQACDWDDYEVEKI